MQIIDQKLANYYRHATVVLKIVRFIVLLCFVVFSLFSIVFFRENITVDNLRYLFKYIDLSTSDSTPSNAEITIAAGESSVYTLFGNDLAIVDENGVGLYDFAGNKLYKYEHSYANAAITMGKGGKNMLVYDTMSGKLAIYNAVSKVLEKETEYPVRSASLNDLGYFAVIGSEKTYRSGVIVFDPKGEEIFRYMSPDKYLTGVALNDNATKVLCSATSGKGGAFYSTIMLYNTASGEKIAEVEIADALALKVGYAPYGENIFVLTDSSFLCYDKHLEKVGEAFYNPENAKFFRVYDDLFLIAESGNLSGGAMTLTAYDYTGAMVFEVESEKKILDVCYNDKTLYVLESDSLAIFDYGTAENTLTSLCELPLDKQYRAVRADDYGRFILVGAKNAKRQALAEALENNK